MKKFNLFAMLFAAAAVMTACLNEKPEVTVKDTGAQPIELNLSEMEEVVTRGTPITAENLVSGNKFRIYASSYNGSAYSSLLGDNFGVVNADNSTAKLQNSSSEDQTYYWPATSTKARFICYYLPDLQTPITSASFTAATPQLSFVYTLPAYAAQRDLLFETTEVNKPNGVSLLFKHALTRVTFELGGINNPNSTAVTMRSIEIKNARSKRTLTVGTAGSWNAATPTDKSTYTATVTTAITAVAGTTPTYTNVLGGTNAFLMLPMTKDEFTVAGTIVTVNLTVGGANVSYDVSIDNASSTYPDWEMGKWVNYRMVLDVSNLVKPIVVTQVKVAPWGAQQNVNVGTIN